jgi:TolA-binding protein
MMKDIKTEKKRNLIIAIVTSLFIAFILISFVNDAGASLALSKVRLSPLDLSKTPTTEEIMSAGQLGGPLYPTHEIDDKEKEKKINLSFGNAIEKWNRHEYETAVQMFRDHVEQYPDSPWTSEAVLLWGAMLIIMADTLRLKKTSNG